MKTNVLLWQPRWFVVIGRLLLEFLQVCVLQLTSNSLQCFVSNIVQSNKKNIFIKCWSWTFNHKDLGFKKAIFEIQLDLQSTFNMTARKSNSLVLWSSTLCTCQKVKDGIIYFQVDRYSMVGFDIKVTESPSHMVIWKVCYWSCRLLQFHSTGKKKPQLLRHDRVMNQNYKERI